VSGGRLLVVCAGGGAGEEGILAKGFILEISRITEDSQHLKTNLSH
jgi:hypothetical protein